MVLATQDWNLCAALLLAALFLIAFLVMKLFGSRGGARQAIKNARAALVTFGGLPLLAYLLASAAWELGQPIAVARAAFVYIAVLLPASLFILFIATRRESLFNSYAANLDRLGLLRKRQLRVADADARHYPVEDNLRLTRRVKSYLDRFSAVYGTLPEETVNDFLDGVRGEERGKTVKAGAVTGELFSTFELKTMLPVLGASALIALGWMMVLPPYPTNPASPAFHELEATYGDGAWHLWAAEPVLMPVAFAFLGAYFFSIQMLVKRFMRRDLGPNAYNAVSMRIILATLGVWVTCQLFEPATQENIGHGTLFALSFAVGAFPLIVWQLVANMLKRLPIASVALPNLEGTRPLSAIDGLSVWHEARLDEEDIENVPNLATADIVDLMLNTKISPNRIVDWVDQAILLLVLQPDAQGKPKDNIETKLDDSGIRTASALVAAMQILRGQQQCIVDSFPKDLQDQARSLAAAVQLYPNYPLIQNWLSTEPYFPPDEVLTGAGGDAPPPEPPPSAANASPPLDAPAKAA